jgi:uncharacterized delta-60 repeat protein
MKKITIGLCLLFSAFAFAQDGVPDTSFGTNGYVQAAGDIKFHQELIDGKVMYRLGNKIRRLNLDGSLDTSFAVNGILTMTQPGTSNYYDFLVSNGKVLAFSNTSVDFPPTETYYMGRYNMNGSLDTTFGSGTGSVTLDMNSTKSGLAPKLTFDGTKLLVGGNTVQNTGSHNNVITRRFTLDGTVDFSYNAAPMSGINLGESSVGLSSYDGLIDLLTLTNGYTIMSVAAGYPGLQGFEGWRTGFVIIKPGQTPAYVNMNSFTSAYGGVKGHVTVTANDDIYTLTGGSVGYNNVPQVTNYIYKKTADGASYNAFGTNGELAITLLYGSGKADFSRIAVQPDGKLLLAGVTTTGTDAYDNFNLILARFNTDGTLDTAFGNNGYVLHDIDHPTSPDGNNGVTGLFLSPDATSIYLTGLNNENSIILKYRNDSFLPLIVPDFNPIAEICSGDTVPALQTTSNNGVTGTWTPAVIDNTVSGTYIFTPDASEHATGATLSVTVNQPTASTVTQTACNSFTWNENGTDYTDSGVYTATSTNAAGCTHTATLNLTIAHSATISGSGNQLFLDGATIDDLVVNLSTVVWYASQANAILQINPLAPTTALVNGATYYAGNTTAQGCVSDIFPVTVSILLATDSFDSSNFGLYPNPTSGLITVKYSNEIDTVSIINVLGQQVLAKNIHANEGQIDLSQLNAGTYFVKVTAGDATKTLKVIKK